MRKLTVEAEKLECLHSLTNRRQGMQQKLQMALHWWTTVTSLLSAQGCEFERILPKKCIHQHDISVCNVHWDCVFYVSNNTTLTYTVNGWNAEATWIQIWQFLQQIWIKQYIVVFLQMNVQYHLPSDTIHWEQASALYKYLIPMWVRKLYMKLFAFSLCHFCGLLTKLYNNSIMPVFEILLFCAREHAYYSKWLWLMKCMLETYMWCQAC